MSLIEEVGIKRYHDEEIVTVVRAAINIMALDRDPIHDNRSAFTNLRPM